MTDRYRQALEGLRERCAQEAERITARRRVVAAMANNEAMKPCQVASAIRKIDVQQYYEGAAREIERLRARVAELEEDRQAERDRILGARVREIASQPDARLYPYGFTRAVMRAMEESDGA